MLGTELESLIHYIEKKWNTDPNYFWGLLNKGDLVRIEKRVDDTRSLTMIASLNEYDEVNRKYSINFLYTVDLDMLRVYDKPAYEYTFSFTGFPMSWHEGKMKANIQYIQYINTTEDGT